MARTPRTLLLAVGLALGTGLGACPRQPPASPTPNAEERGVSQLHGTWTYAEDPSGEVAYDDLFRGNQITFGADGAITYQMGDTSFALSGTWAAREWSSAGGVLDVDYGGGQTTVFRVALRDGGLVLEEGDPEPMPPQFWARAGD